MDIFRPGMEMYTTGLDGRVGSYAKIHGMADKEGFIGKEIPLSNQPEMFEKEKQTIIDSAKLMDDYLRDFLPEYNIAFREPKEGSPAVAFCMENITKANNELPPAGLVDDFLAANIQMFLGTQNNTRKGFMVDLDIDNISFGSTLKRPDKKLYFFDYYPTFPLSSKSDLMERVNEITAKYPSQIFPKTIKIMSQLTSK